MSDLPISLCSDVPPSYRPSGVGDDVDRYETHLQIGNNLNVVRNFAPRFRSRFPAEASLICWGSEHRGSSGERRLSALVNVDDFILKSSRRFLGR